MTKTALITGASSGIGADLARIHAERGGNVIAVATNAARLNALKDELEAAHGVAVTPIVQDLSQPGAGSAVYDAVQDAGLTVDYLMNNAGFGGQGYFHERALQDDLNMIAVNMTALTELTRRFLPEFLARGSGRILMTSSMAGKLPGPMQAVYYASKAYVSSFSNALTAELAATPVTVTNLMPGVTDTGFAATSGMDKTALFDRPVSARSVAQTGYDAMLAGKMDVTAGVTFPQKLMMALLPFVPKTMVLRQIFNAQQAQT